MPRPKELTVRPMALSSIRKVRGFTQRQLAEATGGAVSAGMIAQIEAGGRCPSLAGARALAAALTCEVEDFATILSTPSRGAA